MYTGENLNKLGKVGDLAPDAMAAFWAFDKAALADGEIPKKYKELMAVAVALTIIRGPDSIAAPNEGGLYTISRSS